MKRIGILGGTFNPIHKGHIEIAREAVREFGLDFVLVMPSGVSYMKDSNEVLPKEHRAEMTRLAVCKEQRLVYDDRELKREGNSYTFETVLELRQEYGFAAEFYFITGADTLLNIHKWRKPEIIFKECCMVVALRNGSGYDELTAAKMQLENLYAAKISFMSMEPFDVSSTQIRKSCTLGEDVKRFLPEGVFEYIKKEKLYGIK